MDAFGFLKVAAAVPHLGVGDCDYNTERMAALAEEAAQRGVEIAVFQMCIRDRFGIVEMGASACGEIALLASVAEPDYGLLTNVGRAHLEGFGGPEGVRRGKGELFDYLAAHGGTAFVPEEDATLSAMAAERPAMAVERYSRCLLYTSRCV